MTVWALGINHHTAPLDLRGRFAFAIDRVPEVLNGLRQTVARQTVVRELDRFCRNPVRC